MDFYCWVLVLAEEIADFGADLWPGSVCWRSFPVPAAECPLEPWALLCALSTAGHTWPAEIRPLFFPRPRWGRPQILKFGHFQPLLGHHGPARARLYPVMTLKKHLCAINFFFFFSLRVLTVFFFLSPFQRRFGVEQLHGCCRTCFMFLFCLLKANKRKEALAPAGPSLRSW